MEAYNRSMPIRTSAFAAATARGWSIRKLSEESGIPESTLYDLRREYRFPGPKTVSGLMRAFPDLPYERLFVFSNDAIAPVVSASASKGVPA